MATCVASIIGGGYRHANIDLIELRFCPAKRNRSRELDLDHIILSALHGMQRALLEYPEVRAGLILSADRTLRPEVNAAIVRKAIKFRGHGHRRGRPGRAGRAHLRRRAGARAGRSPRRARPASG